MNEKSRLILFLSILFISAFAGINLINENNLPPGPVKDLSRMTGNSILSDAPVDDHLTLGAPLIRDGELLIPFSVDLGDSAALFLDSQIYYRDVNAQWTRIALDNDIYLNSLKSSAYQNELLVPISKVPADGKLRIHFYLCKSSTSKKVSWDCNGRNYVVRMVDVNDLYQNTKDSSLKKTWLRIEDYMGPAFCHEFEKYHGPKICDWPRNQDLNGLDCSEYQEGQVIKTSSTISHNFKCIR